MITFKNLKLNSEILLYFKDLLLKYISRNPLEMEQMFLDDDLVIRTGAWSNLALEGKRFHFILSHFSNTHTLVWILSIDHIEWHRIYKIQFNCDDRWDYFKQYHYFKEIPTYIIDNSRDIASANYIGNTTFQKFKEQVSQDPKIYDIYQKVLKFLNEVFEIEIGEQYATIPYRFQNKNQ